MVSAYTIDDRSQLGAGGYGRVVQARHNDSGEIVAAKIIRTSRMKLSAIEKEVALMGELQHPHVIGLRGVEEIGKEYIIYMELATGGELFSRVISSGCLTEDEARPYFTQLLQAVQYMHASGVAHRDLKLENVLLDGNGKCKVCDFGLAHEYEKGSDGKPVVAKLREVCGSKSYAAPEVLDGRGYEGYPADIWSCGIVRARPRPHDPQRSQKNHPGTAHHPPRARPPSPHARTHATLPARRA
jgi:serine/threonine protein kinase